MLDVVVATRFDRAVTSGKTHPCILGCVREDGSEIEIVTKFAAGCERGRAALVAEAIGAMLAVDLGLPAPEPFVVQLDQDFIQTIPDLGTRSLAAAGPTVTFGSRKLPPGFSIWPPRRPIPRELIETAAEIFAYDALIQNPDRRPDNPNCQFNGANFAIYDHELAFLTEGVIGWRPPWEIGSLQDWARPDRHLFWDQLRGRVVSLARFLGAWEAISDARLAQYNAALPTAWLPAGDSASAMLSYVANVRDNAKAAIDEVVRILR
jgi:hypothetical protein